MWQKYQKGKKAKKNTGLAFFALGLLISLILLGLLLSSITTFFNSFSSDAVSPRDYTWDGKSSFNVALAQINPASKEETTSVSILSLSPRDGKVTVLHVSNQVYLELPKSLGSWQIGNVYKLGQEDDTKMGANLLKLTLRKLTGLPVDGVIVSQNPLALKDQITLFRKNVFSGASFLANIKTDLSPFESLRLVWALSSIRQDKVVSLDFEKSSITQSKLLPDSSRVLGVDTIRLDTFIRENLSDSAIAEENLSIAVFNGTNYPGLAQEGSRVVTNLGGNMIITSTTQSFHQKSYIFVKSTDLDKKLTSSQTFKRFAQTFAPHCINNPCPNDDTKVSVSRAQINIVLGQDYYNNWYNQPK